MAYKDAEKRKAYYKTYYEKNKEKIRDKVNSYHATSQYKIVRSNWLVKNKDRRRTWLTEYGRKRLYNVTSERYITMLENQDNKCGICGDSGASFAIDHDHSCCPGMKSCGKCVRGLLCQTCNLRLGLLESKWAEKANEYLSRYSIFGCE